MCASISSCWAELPRLSNATSVLGDERGRGIERERGRKRRRRFEGKGSEAACQDIPNSHSHSHRFLPSAQVCIVERHHHITSHHSPGERPRTLVSALTGPNGQRAACPFCKRYRLMIQAADCFFRYGWRWEFRHCQTTLG